MQKFIDRINALFGVTMIGSSSNDDRDLNERGKKSKRFRMSKQQHAFFLYISLQEYDVKMPYFTFYQEDVNTRQRLSFYFLNFDKVF